MSYCKSQGGNIATVYNNEENNALIQITKATAYIGAESDGKGNWKWIDGSKWWQPAGTQHDGIVGRGETKIALHTDKKWHDWGVGADKLGVLCAMSLAKPKLPGKIFMNDNTYNLVCTVMRVIQHPL